MPDDVHLLVQVQELDLVTAVSRWKSLTTKRILDSGARGALWQRSFYDHGIRADEDLNAAALYIVQNPLRGRHGRSRTVHLVKLGFAVGEGPGASHRGIGAAVRAGTTLGGRRGPPLRGSRRPPWS